MDGRSSRTFFSAVASRLEYVPKVKFAFLFEGFCSVIHVIKEEQV